MRRDQPNYLHYPILGHEYEACVGNIPQWLHQDYLRVLQPILNLLHVVIKGPAHILHDLVRRLVIKSDLGSKSRSVIFALPDL